MVWTGHRNDSSTTCLDELDSVRVKGLKRRGLSRFYSERSQSFASLELVLCTPHGDSTVALAKRSVSSACSVSSSTACEDIFASRSLPISPGQTVRGVRHTLRGAGQAASLGASSHHSKSEGGACDAGDMVADIVPGRTWQQQAADDICSALRIRCSLGYQADGTRCVSEPLADVTPVSRPHVHRGQLGALLSIAGASS